MPASAKRVNHKLNKARVDSTSKERAPKPSGLTQRKQAKRRSAASAAQNEFLDDLRISLEQVKRGEVVPADEAHKLIDLELDDDELERRLHAQIHNQAQ